MINFVVLVVSASGMKKGRAVILFLLIYSFCFSYLFASSSDSVSKIRIDSNTIMIPGKFIKQSDIDSVQKDALTKKTAAEDSINAIKRRDSIMAAKTKSGIDTVVTFTASDSIRFNLKSKIMRLRGDSKVTYKDQKLQSEIILVYFKESSMESFGTKDTSGKLSGYPKFTDKSENFVGERILYNFKTKQGTIALGETEMSEGFYFGSKIKRVSESEFFVENGCYTTCDKPHPHFYFGSPEMKLIAHDRVIVDPLILYVEDMPVFIVPFGLFFPNKGGRQSGILVPSFFFSANRGVTLENFGLYLALSDYYDTQFSGNFYSKGGYTFKNFTQWKLLDVLDGNIELQYGKTRFNPYEKYTTNWSVRFRHNQTLTPQSQVVANLSFSSQDFNRNTSPNLRDRIQQNMTSNASFSKSFDNGSNFSISYNRNQNIITNEYNQTPSVSFSLPQWFVLKPYVSPNTWLKDVIITYSGNAVYNHSKFQKIKSYTDENQKFVQDTSFDYKYSTKISHSPGISISPKFGNFTFNPSFSFRANNYFRRLNRIYNADSGTTKDEISNGFFSEYSYSAGINLSTRLFGIVKPKLLGLNAIRHTLQPSVGFSYTPDQSSSDLGFYGSYYDTRAKRDIKYSRYELDEGGIASRYTSKSLNYSINNNFGAKIARGDTLEDLALDLLSLSLNGSYNFAADSLRASDISLSFHTPALGDISLNGNAAFTLYDEVKTYNPYTQSLSDNYTKVDQFLISNGKGIARLTRFGLNMSANFSSSGISIGRQTEVDTSGTKKDSAGLGERFRQRHESTEGLFDFFGENSPGFTPLKIPWNIALSLNYQLSQPTVNQKTESININATFSLKLTQSWSIDGSTQYDFTRRELMAPTFNIRKDMHCWELVFTWYPMGLNAGYYLKFGIKAANLKDLMIEKRSNPIF